MAKNRKKINWKSKKTWKNVLIIGLAVITLVGAIVGLSALFRKSEETTKEINPTYAVGGLTENGAYLETEESIYTEDAFECQGLDIELDFRSNVSYRVFFYDVRNDFLSSTAKLTSNYDETTTPVIARYARIVITPNEDNKISWYEKSGYANQLTISVNKEQDDANLEFISSNLFKYAGQGTVNTETWSIDTGSDALCSQFIDVAKYDKVAIIMDADLWNSANTIINVYDTDEIDGVDKTKIVQADYDAEISGDNVIVVLDNVASFEKMFFVSLDNAVEETFANIQVFAVK